MAIGKKETINPNGTIRRISQAITYLLSNPIKNIGEVPLITGLLTGTVQRSEYNNLWRRYNAGLIKKAELIAYSELGTPHQRKIAKKLLRGDDKR